MVSWVRRNLVDVGDLVGAGCRRLRENGLADMQVMDDGDG